MRFIIMFRTFCIVLPQNETNKRNAMPVSHQGGKGRFPEGAPEHRTRVASRHHRSDQEFIPQDPAVVARGSSGNPVALANTLSRWHADF